MCIFDGHGGKFCAEKLKKNFHNIFAEHLPDGNFEDAQQVLLDSFLAADKDVAEFEYEGATGTAVFIWNSGGERYLQAANLGDSTAFLCRSGKAIQLTIDHNPSNPLEKTRIRAEGHTIGDNQGRLNGKV